MVLINPYIAGNPVGGGDAFIGRADVLREVLRTLQSPHENALLLYGQRRIGKTSVLQELKERLPAEGAYLPVYFDLQDQAALPVDQLLQGLSKRIIQDLGLEVTPLKMENAEEAFQHEFLPKILSQFSDNTSIVLLLDEFDVLDNPAEGKASERFFPYLRKLLRDNSQRLQFIFVIGRRPDDLTNITNSVFKGTRSYPVSLLAKEDTISLVRLSEINESLSWADTSIEQVYAYTGGHPFLTQQLCQEIWEEHYQDATESISTIEVAQVKRAIPAALSAARHALEWLWNGLAPAERVVAAALAEAGSGVITQMELEQRLQESGVRILIGELQNAPKVLQDWDLILEQEDGFCFRVELLRQWISERKALSRVQEEIDRIQPVAENLFQAAYASYSGGKMEQAVAWLQQAIGFNPNHLRANQLLGEIFLAQGNLEEARKVLETLYQYQPAAAKPRLVQTMLLQAAEMIEEDEALKLYERILNIDSNQIEAWSRYQKVWIKRGERELSIYKNKKEEIDPLESLNEAIKAFEKAKLNEKVEEVKDLLSEEYFRLKDLEILELDKQSKYQEALEIAEELHDRYSKDRKKLPNLEVFRQKVKLNDIYSRALIAIQENNYIEAQKLLIEIISIQPEYKEATHYLHFVVKGVDAKKINQTLQYKSKDLARLRIQNSKLKAELNKFETVNDNLFGAQAPRFLSRQFESPSNYSPSFQQENLEISRHKNIQAKNDEVQSYKENEISPFSSDLSQLKASETYQRNDEIEFSNKENEHVSYEKEPESSDGRLPVDDYLSLQDTSVRTFPLKVKQDKKHTPERRRGVDANVVLLRMVLAGFIVPFLTMLILYGPVQRVISCLEGEIKCLPYFRLDNNT